MTNESPWKELWPWRILVAGGGYQVTNRGHRRSDLYRTDTERQRFLGLVAQLPDRIGVEVHAFVLMDNHYHLLVGTLEPNLHHAIRWLQVSYAMRYNWARRQCDAVFTGRFKAVLIQEIRGVMEVTRYYAVRHGGHRLAEVVAQMPTVKYPVAAQAIKRFGLALENDAVRRRFVADLKRQLSNI